MAESGLEGAGDDATFLELAHVCSDGFSKPSASAAAYSAVGAHRDELYALGLFVVMVKFSFSAYVHTPSGNRRMRLRVS